MKTTWELDDATWRDLAARCPGATFFHAPGWHRLQAERNGYMLATARFDFGPGHEALLPLAIRRTYRGVLREALSGVGWGYGGLVATRPLSREQVDEAYEAVLDRYPDLVVIGNPFESGPSTPSAGTHSAELTQAITLLPADQQLAAMTSERARQTRRAFKDGFELVAVEAPTEDDVASFFPVYAEHSANWPNTQSIKDEAYFRGLFRHLGADVTLFKVMKGSELAAFRIVCRQGKLATGMHLARAGAHERTGAGPFLAAASMAWLHEHGVERLDLLSSGPLDGVRSYKASLGAEALPYGVVSNASWVGASLRRMRQAIAS